MTAKGAQSNRKALKNSMESAVLGEIQGVAVARVALELADVGTAPHFHLLDIPERDLDAVVGTIAA